MKKKNLLENGKMLSLLCAALALVCFIFACTVKSKISVLLHILWVLALLGGIYLLYATNKAKEERVNYFLYDRRRKKKVSPENVTFDLINDNLTFYLATYIKKPVELWCGFPKSLYIQTQAEELYLPMIAYRMLYELSLREDEEILQRFVAAREKTVSFVCHILRVAGDEEMAALILKMKREPEAEAKHIVAFFQKNKAVFEGRMVHFVKTHPDGFMVDKESI